MSSNDEYESDERSSEPEIIQAGDFTDLFLYINQTQTIPKFSDTRAETYSIKPCVKFTLIEKKDITAFFKRYEKAVNNPKNRLMIAEKQNKVSGIMIDFDIYYDENNTRKKSRIDNNIYRQICKEILKLYLEYLVPESSDIKKIYIGVTKKDKITYDEENKWFKDGFHILIPGVMVSKETKKFLLNKIIERSIIEQVFEGEITPSQNRNTYLQNNIKNIDTLKFPNLSETKKSYGYSDFIDTACCYVPVFLNGSYSRPDAKSNHRIHKVYYYNTTKKSDSFELFEDENQMQNISHEFSILHEGQIIKKCVYNLKPEYFTNSQNSPQDSQESQESQEPVSNYYGEMNLNNHLDIQRKEIINLLNILDTSRFIEYNKWISVIRCLANMSKSYEDIARWFSQKCKEKYNEMTFLKYWGDACSWADRNYEKRSGISLLKRWAKEDNYTGYQEIIKTDISTHIKEYITERITLGKFNHDQYANIIAKLTPDRFVTDVEGKNMVWYEFMVDKHRCKDGGLYKWRRYDNSENLCGLNQFIANGVVKNIFDAAYISFENQIKKINVEDTEKIKACNIMKENFRRTVQNLGNTSTINCIIKQLAAKVEVVGFRDMIDKEQYVKGVYDGILKLTDPSDPESRPYLIKGFHDYKISAFTNVKYVPFCPHDEITQQILLGIRSLFLDNETDSFEYFMYMISSSLDYAEKSPVLALMVALGKNGKSFILEFLQEVIGTNCIKVKPAFFTEVDKTNEGTSNFTANLLYNNATLVYSTETSANDIVRMSKVKEITSDNITARKNFGDPIQGRVNAVYIIASNFNLKIEGSDMGTWRRIVYFNMKVTFKHKDEELTGKNERFEVPECMNWKKLDSYKSRFMGILVYYHYLFQKKYKGRLENIKAPHLELDTLNYRMQEDHYTSWVSGYCVKSKNGGIIKICDVLNNFKEWARNNNKNVIVMSEEIMMQTELKGYVKKGSKGNYIEGIRILKENEDPEEDEKYLIVPKIYKEPENNFGVLIETPEEYVERIKNEYNEKYKKIFEATDDTFIVELSEQEKQLLQVESKSDKIPEGVVIEELKNLKFEMEIEDDHECFKQLSLINENLMKIVGKGKGE